MNDSIAEQPVSRENNTISGKRTARDLLLLLVTPHVSPGRKAQISRLMAGTVDWKYLFQIAEFHGVLPFIAYNVFKHGLADLVPRTYLNKLTQFQNGTLFANVILSTEQLNVISHFTRSGVEAIVLKGTILAEQLYNNPYLRTTTDIDILVTPEKLSSAGNILIDMNYGKVILPETRNHPFHDVYVKKSKVPIAIELHWNLDSPKLIKVPQQTIWQRSRSVETQGNSVKVLSWEDTLLSLCNNLTKQDDHRLKCLCDIDGLIRKLEEELDWQYVVESARSWEMEAAAYYSLMLSRTLLGTPVPDSVIDGLKPGALRRWFLGFLVSPDYFISVKNMSKFRTETYYFVRCLVMKSLDRSTQVMARYRGKDTKMITLRNIFWMSMVMIGAVGRNILQGLNFKGWQVRVYKD